ncbi:hypothetical protein EGW08_005201 [Elysia chlorotica]|uniref:Uncharacterized protein n=1 Tax=Elysia chlorotica TaxID=188477 RepID=A0A3S1BRM4_ELYCH|nr:hypothetical protein EGW08_005201 [Elysia chlorotica]
MFIIPAIKQAAMGLEEDSLLGTMHLNALNGSGDVLGSSSNPLGSCFGGSLVPGTSSSSTAPYSTLSTPSYNRARGQRKGEVFGGLFGACVSDNHPYRPHDSGTASLFREDPRTSPTAHAVVNAGLATAGTTQFVSPDALSATMGPESRTTRYSGETRSEVNMAARKSGEIQSLSKNQAQKLQHQNRVDSDNCIAQPGDIYNQDIYISKHGNSRDGCMARHEGQYTYRDPFCHSSSHNDLCSFKAVEERLMESQVLTMEKEAERKRRGKGKEHRRHSLDLDLAHTAQTLSAASSSRKDGRTKSAHRGRNSIPSELELALHSARSGHRQHRLDLGTCDLDRDDVTLSISEVQISTDVTSGKGREVSAGSHETKSGHAHRKHRRAYTTDSTTSARAMKLLEKCKEKKPGGHDHVHVKTCKHHHQHKQEAHCGDGTEYNHKQQHISKSSSNHHAASSRPSSGARHLFSRHLSDNTATHRSTGAEAAPSNDSDPKTRGKLLSRFSLE